MVGKGGGTNTVPALRVNFPLFVRCDGEGDINESCFLTGRVGMDTKLLHWSCGVHSSSMSAKQTNW